MAKKTHIYAALASAVIFGMFAGCEKPQTGNEQTGDERAEEVYLRKSAEIASELQKSLGSRLKEALGEGGPVEAIKVCKDMAGPITEKSSGLIEGATVSRTALRVRNPDNAPDSYSREVLEGWNQRLEQGEPLPSADLRDTDDRIIVHRPIETGAMCLTCHGELEQMEPELQAALEQAYPDDQATGFEEGDLRGAFRVVFER